MRKSSSSLTLAALPCSFVLAARCSSYWPASPSSSPWSGVALYFRRARAGCRPSCSTMRLGCSPGRLGAGPRGVGYRWSFVGSGDGGADEAAFCGHPLPRSCARLRRRSAWTPSAVPALAASLRVASAHPRPRAVLLASIRVPGRLFGCRSLASLLLKPGPCAVLLASVCGYGAGLRRSWEATGTQRGLVREGEWYKEGGWRWRRRRRLAPISLVAEEGRTAGSSRCTSRPTSLVGGEGRHGVRWRRSGQWGEGEWALGCRRANESRPTSSLEGGVRGGRRRRRARGRLTSLVGGEEQAAAGWGRRRGPIASPDPSLEGRGTWRGSSSSARQAPAHIPHWRGGARGGGWWSRRWVVDEVGGWWAAIVTREVLDEW
ncbi:hypothetical protein BJ912DRAFT_935311 [Pholiota molesta]|nr:hypothetical protein BJ912DRAFT_935311 [Pholiota molesta]